MSGKAENTITKDNKRIIIRFYCKVQKEFFVFLIQHEQYTRLDLQIETNRGTKSK